MATEEDWLIRASSAGDVPEMERLLQDPKMLEAACRVRDQSLGFGLGHTTVPHLSLMMQAAAKPGQASMVEFLLSAGRLHDIQLAELIDADTISNAIMSKEVGVLKVMFAALPGLISYNLGMGLSPLEHSIAIGSIPIITFLLENGADPNYSFNPNSSPLQDAAGRSSLQIVVLLLRFGASTSRSWACHAAVRYGKVDVLKVLLERGADINQKLPTQPGSYYRDLETPLDVAVRHEQTAAAKWLVDKGAKHSLVIGGNQYQERSRAGQNDHHTGEQWLTLMNDDEDTPEAYAARRAARRVRRERNRRERITQTSGSIEDTTGTA